TLGLGHPLLRQRYIHPAGEQVLRVPFALAVTEQYQRVGHGSSVPHAKDCSMHTPSPPRRGESVQAIPGTWGRAPGYRPGGAGAGPVPAEPVRRRHVRSTHIGPGTAMRSVASPACPSHIRCTATSSAFSPATSTYSPATVRCRGQAAVASSPSSRVLAPSSAIARVASVSAPRTPTNRRSP